MFSFHKCDARELGSFSSSIPNLIICLASCIGCPVFLVISIGAIFDISNILFGSYNFCSHRGGTMMSRSGTSFCIFPRKVIILLRPGFYFSEWFHRIGQVLWLLVGLGFFFMTRI